MLKNKSYTTKQTDTGDSKETAKYGSAMDFASNEAFNLLRTNTVFAAGVKSGCKTIGITSSVAGEGKTYVTINLAYSLAEAGMRTLLIDGDMRRSNLARRLGVVNSPGLSNYIIDTSLSGIIRSTELSKNLYVIPAGDFPPNPSELLGSEMMKRVIEYLSKNFEYIVFDLPPVQAVADPLVASRFLDGVIVVARDKITRKGELKDTIRQLSFVNANILGVVYNGVGDSSAGRKRKYYNHYYKYGKYYTASGGDASKPKSEEQK